MMTTTVTAASFVQGFLYFVGVFFVLYLIGYSTFLFLSVTVGSSILYRRKREAHYQNQASWWTAMCPSASSCLRTTRTSRWKARCARF